MCVSVSWRKQQQQKKKIDEDKKKVFFKWAHIIKLLKAKERILKMARQPEGTGDLNVMRQAEEHARTFASCPSGFDEHLFMEIFLKGEKTHTTQMKR